MAVIPHPVVENDAYGSRAGAALLAQLWNGSVLRVSNLFSHAAAEHLIKRLLASQRIVDHSDVEGLRVIGLSHFQAARNSDLRQQYIEEGRSCAGALRSLASPYASPFDSALAFLAQNWPAGCQIMTLPTEGPLAPFTIRIYREGVGIEPHQDILGAESPGDQLAQSLTMQFAANLYLSMGTAGGGLELFDSDDSKTDYKDLSKGPRVVSRDELPPPTVVIPKVGDLIIFPSRRIHAVAASSGQGLRITISFFVGVQHNRSLMIWA